MSFCEKELDVTPGGILSRGDIVKRDIDWGDVVRREYCPGDIVPLPILRGISPQLLQ